MSIVISDVTRRRVYNYQVFLAFLLVIWGGFLWNYRYNVSASLICFVIGFVLWKVGAVGGGDVKLLSVLILGLEQSDISLFFLFMSVIGFVLAIFTLLSRSRERGVPYAPAIVFAYTLASMI